MLALLEAFGEIISVYFLGFFRAIDSVCSDIQAIFGPRKQTNTCSFCRRRTSLIQPLCCFWRGHQTTYGLLFEKKSRPRPRTKDWCFLQASLASKRPDFAPVGCWQELNTHFVPNLLGGALVFMSSFFAAMPKNLVYVTSETVRTIFEKHAAEAERQEVLFWPFLAFQRLIVSYFLFFNVIFFSGFLVNPR